MLIVAIHDVARAELSEVRWLLDRLDAIGVDRRVLKVIPAVSGGPHDEVAQLLRSEAAAGSEVVLHGWSHVAAGRLRGSAPDRIRARLFAADAAEFLTLGERDVAERLALGRQWLEAAGVASRGFCPPGWLASATLPATLRASGFQYLITLRGIRDLRRRRWITLPPVGYMGAGVSQERLVTVGSAVLARPLRHLLGSPAWRFFLHPQGASRSGACARILAEIAVAAQDHRPGTYGDLLDD